MLLQIILTFWGHPAHTEITATSLGLFAG